MQKNNEYKSLAGVGIGSGVVFTYETIFGLSQYLSNKNPAVLMTTIAASLGLITAVLFIKLAYINYKETKEIIESTKNQSKLEEIASE